MKKLLIYLSFITAVLLSSCAEPKDININGRTQTIEPYGWMNADTKNDSVIYKVSTPTIVWSIILSETLVCPLIFTGVALYEPERAKYNIKSNKP